MGGYFTGAIRWLYGRMGGNTAVPTGATSPAVFLAQSGNRGFQAMPGNRGFLSRSS